jgi:predicted ATPase
LIQYFNVVMDVELKESLSTKIQLELGKNDFGSVLSSIVPEIELIIEKQLKAPKLRNSQEFKERVYNSFFSFFKCFSELKSFLVLIVDDLQWADICSVDLLQYLLENKINGIKILGSYRENEVKSNQPLSMFIFNFTSQIEILHLEPLNLENLNELVSDSLELPKSSTIQISEIIFNKTFGNPYFSKEMLNSFYEEDLIFLKNGIWSWKIEELKKKDLSSNVIDFMIKKLQKEPETIQKILQCASCIGNEFSIEELLWIYEDKEMFARILELVKKGWIVQLNTSNYKFSHDRLQQASYELISEEMKLPFHHIIGMKLLRMFTKKNCVNQKIFVILQHLNKASSLIENKLMLVHLNSIAAKKCLNKCAFKFSFHFSSIAKNFLPKDVWNDFTSDLYLLHANCCHAAGEIQEAKNSFQILLNHLETSGTRVKKLKIFSEYMKVLEISFDFDIVFDCLLEVFDMFEFSKEISKIYHDREKISNYLMDLKSKLDEKTRDVDILSLDSTLSTCFIQELVLLQVILTECHGAVYLSSKTEDIMPILCNVCMFNSNNSSIHLPLFRAWIDIQCACWICNWWKFDFLLF